MILFAPFRVGANEENQIKLTLETKSQNIYKFRNSND
jgi:hypothetical protein